MFRNIELRVEVICGERYVCPMGNVSTYWFMHCSKGRTEIHESEFDENFKSLLRLHNLEPKINGTFVKECEIYGEVATNIIQDTEPDLHARNAGIEAKVPHGKPHYFCDEHTRESKHFD